MPEIAPAVAPRRPSRWGEPLQIAANSLPHDAPLVAAIAAPAAAPHQPRAPGGSAGESSSSSNNPKQHRRKKPRVITSDSDNDSDDETSEKATKRRGTGTEDKPYEEAVVEAPRFRDLVFPDTDDDDGDYVEGDEEAVAPIAFRDVDFTDDDEEDGDYEPKKLKASRECKIVTKNKLETILETLLELVDSETSYKDMAIALDVVKGSAKRYVRLAIKSNYLDKAKTEYLYPGKHNTEKLLGLILRPKKYNNLDKIFKKTEKRYRWSKMGDGKKREKFWQIVDELYRQKRLRFHQTDHLKDKHHTLGQIGETKTKMLNFFTNYLEKFGNYVAFSTLNELATAFTASKFGHKGAKGDSNFRKRLKELEKEKKLEPQILDFIKECREKRGR